MRYVVLALVIVLTSVIGAECMTNYYAWIDMDTAESGEGLNVYMHLYREDGLDNDFNLSSIDLKNGVIGRATLRITNVDTNDADLQDHTRYHNGESLRQHCKSVDVQIPVHPLQHDEPRKVANLERRYENQNRLGIQDRSFHRSTIRQDRRV